MPPPEYNRSNTQHAAAAVAANRIKLEKRKKCCACFACLNALVQYGTAHLNCR